MSEELIEQEERLGEYIRTYKFSTVRMLASLITWLLYGGVFTFVFFAALRQSGFETWMLFYLLIPLMGWIGAIEVIVSTIRNWGMSLDLFRDGFVFHTRSGIHAMQWGDVEQFRLHVGVSSIKGIIPVVLQYRIEVICKDGERFTIPRQLQDIRKLGDLLVSKLGKVQMPEAVERLKRGETLDFGKYKVQRDALIRGDRRFEWREIKSFGPEQGEVFLRLKPRPELGSMGQLKRGFFWRTDPSKIPNVSLLVELVNLFMNESRAKGET